MLHAGLDLSRRKLEVCLLSEEGEHLDQLAVPPDADSLRTLVRRIAEVHAEPVLAVIESMTGARIVHDTLEQEGWGVEIADAQKVKGLAPLACKTDKIDSKVLATLSHRDLVPAIWLPDPRVREERELARFRLHLVKHKSALKNRIHSTLINFGVPCPVTDLFGLEGRRLLERLQVPEPWRGNISELRILLERVILARSDEVIRVEDLLTEMRLDGALTPLVPNGSLREARRRFEREYVAAVLQHHRWRMTDAARALGIQRTNLYRKARQLGLRRGRAFKRDSG